MTASAALDRARFATLRSRREIDDALTDLRRSNRWPDPGPARGPMRLLERFRPRLRPDPIKAWDVKRALDLIEATVPRDRAVLDMGSVGCPILPALCARGYEQLFGIDLDPAVERMPRCGTIDYIVGDMTATPFPAAEFAAITSISVIEHGVPQDALFAEVSRLLTPGGRFVFSTDYWPEKIDTSGIEPFGRPWRIFSASDIVSLVECAAQHGLRPVHHLSDDALLSGETPIRFSDRSYTFLYGVLERRDQ
jgi:SAM-dependent methyltransferase